MSEKEVMINERDDETEAKASEKESMKQIRVKLTTAKGRVARVLNNIESAMEKFEEYEKGRGSAKRLNATAKEIQSQYVKPEKEYEEMEEAMVMLTNVILTFKE